MTQLHRSVVTLRISGDDLDPDEITRLLGASPTKAQSKGEKIVGKNLVRIAHVGLWRIAASDRTPEEMNGQIREILSQMTGDLAVWQGITKRYHADLFCGLYIRSWNEGLSISADSVEALGVRGIELNLEIYREDNSVLVKLDCRRIHDWDSFHTVFAEAFGFPSFYGRNMDAWIDCMTDLDDTDTGMCVVSVKPGGVVELQLEHVDDFAGRCPEQYTALLDSIAFVNWRRIDEGQSAVLALSYHKKPP